MRNLFSECAAPQLEPTMNKTHTVPLSNLDGQWPLTVMGRDAAGNVGSRRLPHRWAKLCRNRRKVKVLPGTQKQTSPANCERIRKKIFFLYGKLIVKHTILLSSPSDSAGLRKEPVCSALSVHAPLVTKVNAIPSCFFIVSMSRMNMGRSAISFTISPSEPQTKSI